MRYLLTALLFVVGCYSAWAQPPASMVPEATALRSLVSSFDITAYGVANPAMAGTVVYVDSYGAAGNGVTDDTTAITSALAAIPSGGTVVFTSGKVYRKTADITVGASTILWGYGSVVYDDTGGSTTPPLAFHLTGAHSAVYGLTFISDLSTRVSNTDSGAIWMDADDLIVVDVQIEYHGVCIFNQGTHTFESRNVCYRSWADGLTAAGGGLAHAAPAYVIVVGNVVRQTGDEMISLVNYGGIGAPTLHDVLISYNDVSDQYWSNGISCHGCQHVTISHNTISKIPFNSGIIVDSTTSFTERDADDVLIVNNDLTDIQTLAPSYNPIPGVHSSVPHGAIYDNSATGHSVTNLMIDSNRVNGSVFAGVQVQTGGGTICNLGYKRLRLLGIQATNPVNIQSSLASCVACDDIQFVDHGRINPANCTGTMPTVTGSSYLVH